MKEKILKVIKKYNLIENGDRLVLGVSGGPDSIAMLNILNDIKNDKNILNTLACFFVWFRNISYS